MISTNINSKIELITQLTDVSISDKQNYIDHNHITDKNEVATKIDNYYVCKLNTTDCIVDPILKRCLLSDNANLFKQIISADKCIHKKPKNFKILKKYISMTIDYKANECLIEVLKILIKNNIKDVLNKDHKFYHYIRNNLELREIILQKYYYAIGCRGIYNILYYAICTNNKNEAITSFNILLKKFPLDYVANQYIVKYHNPIVYAIEKDNFNIFKALINISPDFFVSIAENNKTPLMIVAQNKDSKFLAFLLQCKYTTNSTSYQEQLKTALSIAIEYQNDENIKLLIEHAPLIVFENFRGDDKNILATLFHEYPNYFAMAITNKIIANQAMNPVFTADFSFENNHISYKLLISLQKQIAFNKLQLNYNKQSKIKNNNQLIDALIDYKAKKKQFCLDHINVDYSSIENLNLKMISLVSFMLPKLKNLAVYIKTKQYYHYTNKIFSYGDENASISLINWLIKLGATQIKIILSPPDDSTPNSRKYLSKRAQQHYHEQKLFCLQKISHLFPIIKYNSIKSQKKTYLGCKLHIGFVDDNNFMQNYFYSNNTICIKKYNMDAKLLKYNGVIITFSANEIYKELVTDNLIIIKPFAFAKKCEQLHTDLYIDKNNKSVYANMKSLSNAPCSIIPEIKTNIDLKYNSVNYVSEWIIAALAKIDDGNNIATVINLIQQYVQQNIIDHSAIYGLHHNNIRDNACNIIKNWVSVIDNFRYNRSSATVISIFPNNLLLDIDVLTYSRNDIIFLPFSDTNIITNFELAIAEKKIIIFRLPPIPKQVFQFLISNSNLPMLTEGANTTSFLLQEGIPYLSLLPNYTTKIPYNIGNPLQSFLIEALSHKLVLSENSKLQLANIYNLVKQKKFTEAKYFIDYLRSEYNNNPSCLFYLWIDEETTSNLIQETKITAYKLITTGKKLGTSAYNILLQALSADLNSISMYIKQVIIKDTQEQEHIKIIKHSLQHNFNNVVITSLYQFFKEKRLC